VSECQRSASRCGVLLPDTKGKCEPVALHDRKALPVGIDQATRQTKVVLWSGDLERSSASAG
jgi:hypothetical protein